MKLSIKSKIHFVALFTFFSFKPIWGSALLSKRQTIASVSSKEKPLLFVVVHILLHCPWTRMPPRTDWLDRSGQMLWQCPRHKDLKAVNFNRSLSGNWNYQQLGSVLGWSVILSHFIETELILIYLKLQAYYKQFENLTTRMGIHVNQHS
jgi:hypothetical protein